MPFGLARRSPRQVCDVSPEVVVYANLKRLLHQIWRSIIGMRPSAPSAAQPSDSDVISAPRGLSRDTVVLVAALVFLSFAIALAALFPPNRREVATTSQTPSATAPAEPTASSVPPTAAAPTAGAGAAPAPYPAPGQEAAAPTPLPTAAPLLPSPAPGAEGTPVDALASQPTAYPPPDALAVPTVDPALVPTVDPALVPTIVVAQPTAEPLPAATAAPAPDTQPATPTPVITDEGAAPAAPTAPVQAASSDPPPTRAPPPPTAVPVDVVRGTAYWTAARSPYTIGRDLQVLAGAALIIEPGVEVRVAPGVSIYVDGQLLALGRPGSPVRLVAAGRPRWEGIFGRTGSSVVLENTDITGAGAGGTAIAVENGTLALRGARLRDSGGQVRATASSVEVRDSEIAGNDMPYGAALDVAFSAGGGVTLINNRIGGNRMAAGAPPVLITSQSPFDIINLDIQRNLLVGQDGPGLSLVTNGQLQGGIICNALVGGANGLSVRGSLPQVPGLPLLRVRENAIEKHTPPILPIYLEFGIGRGATSSVELDMRENWWESDTGPYEPDRHADGRGDAVGENIAFDPWLKARPACAPNQ